MKKLIVNRQLDIILDSIADGVFTTDSDSNITYFNRAAEKITGVPRKLAIGQKCFDVLRANICQTSCALKATIDSGESRINLPGFQKCRFELFRQYNPDKRRWPKQTI